MPLSRNKFKSPTWTTGLLGGLILVTIALGACRSAREGATSVQTSSTASMPGNPNNPNNLGNPNNPGNSGSATPLATPDERPILLAFGDSLTAGYGLPAAEAYPNLLQQKIDAAGYRYRVVNAGVSGDTTAGGLRRLEWSLEGPVKVVVLALGGNDGLRGQPVEEMKSNLARMIEIAQRRGVKVVLAGMEAPPNLGPDYTGRFRAVYRELARQYRTPLIPFLLEDIGGRPELNQPDGIHPNFAGEQILTENVWRVVEGELAR